MHDVGKIGVPDRLLLKEERSPEEENVFYSHASIGWEILRKSSRELVVEAAVMARDHHEHWDGSGFPVGRSGEDIHINGRMLAFAQELDEHWVIGRSGEEIIAELESQKGGKLDPTLVDIFLQSPEAFFSVLKALERKSPSFSR